MLFALLLLAIGLNADAQQYKLWYEKPATDWHEALPIGNSHMGAMIYGGTQCEEVQLNEETFWSGAPHNNNSTEALSHLAEVRRLIFNNEEEKAAELINKHFIKKPFGMKYLLLGSMFVEFPGVKQVSNYRRELDLATAMHHVSYESDGVRYTRSTYASLPDNVIVMRLDANKKKALRFKVSHKCLLPTTHRVSNHTLTATVRGVEHEGVPAGLTAECQMYVQSDGVITDHADGIEVSGASEAAIYIVAATNFVNYHDVSGNPTEKNCRTLAAAKSKGRQVLLRNHVQTYCPQYTRVRLELPVSTQSDLPTDERLARFAGGGDMQLAALMFQYGRYLLISSSQPDNINPANLQGIWNEKMFPSWDSKYTTNINLEMNYWPSEVCNLTEMNGPLFRLIHEISETGRQTAHDMYGAEGWVLHHNTDQWRITGPVDHASTGLWSTGSGWICRHLWEHYLYSGDKEFLREAYPIMLEAARFYTQTLVKHPRLGYLVICPGESPEHGGKGRGSTLDAGVTMDNQIVTELFTEVLQAAKVLDDNSPLLQTIREQLPQLAPMKVGSWGQLQEWLDDVDDPKDDHRHFSHLYGLYPSNQITASRTPELFEAAKVSLQHRGDVSTGWSMGWKVCSWARFFDGNHAYKLIQDQLTLTADTFLIFGTTKQHGGTYPNMFDAHPPFQIDGNFGCTAGIAEMLLQSHETTKEGLPILHLLPALPDVWKDGSISGLRARGGFEVSMNWSGNRLSSAVIKSMNGGTLTVRTATPLKQKGKKEGSYYLYNIKTRKGQTITLNAK